MLYYVYSKNIIMKTNDVQINIQLINVFFDDCYVYFLNFLLLNFLLRMY